MSAGMSSDQIQEHMEIVGSDGQHVGTVDHVQGDELKLTRKDSPDNKHHFLPLTHVASVSDKVHLSIPASEAKMASRAE